MKRIAIIILIAALSLAIGTAYAAWDKPSTSFEGDFGTGEWLRQDEPKYDFSDVIFEDATYTYASGVEYSVSVKGGAFDDADYAAKGFLLIYTITPEEGQISGGNSATARGNYTVCATMTHPFYNTLYLYATLKIV